jgi:hypothetical protein
MVLKHFASNGSDKNNRYQLAAFLAHALMLCVTVHNSTFLLYSLRSPPSFCALGAFTIFAAARQYAVLVRVIGTTYSGSGLFYAVCSG